MTPCDIRKMQAEHKIWEEYNFKENPAYHKLLGMIEEAGELAHAHLKMEQNIRGSKDEHIAEAKDAIGDLVIYLSGYCNRMGFDLAKIITETWGQVKQRDWVRFPKNGKTE